MKAVLTVVLFLAVACFAQNFAPVSCGSFRSKGDCLSRYPSPGRTELCCIWCDDAKVCLDGYVSQSNGVQQCNGGSECSSASDNCQDTDRCPNRVPLLGNTWYYHISPSLPEYQPFCNDQPGTLAFSVYANSISGAAFTASQSEPFTSSANGHSSLISGGNVDNYGNIVTNEGCKGFATDKEIDLYCPPTANLAAGCNLRLTRSSAVSVVFSLGLLIVLLIAQLF